MTKAVLKLAWECTKFLLWLFMAGCVLYLFAFAMFSGRDIPVATVVYYLSLNVLHVAVMSVRMYKAALDFMQFCAAYEV